MSDLVDRLIAMKPRSYGPAGLFDLLGDAAAEITDLTKANGILHAIVSNREEEISGLRAQLASASERVAEMQAEAGMYHSLYDMATERLASARKALEEIESTYQAATVAAQIATAALLSLTDEKST